MELADILETTQQAEPEEAEPVNKSMEIGFHKKKKPINKQAEDLFLTETSPETVIAMQKGEIALSTMPTNLDPEVSKCLIELIQLVEEMDFGMTVKF